MFYDLLKMVVDIVSGIVAGFLLLRFWMQTLRVRPPASFANSIFRLTDWIVRPIRRVVPGFGGFDWASLIAALLIALTSSAVISLAAGQMNVILISCLAVFHLLQWMIFGLMGLLILEVIFSFVNPYAPLAPLVSALNQPFLAPIRRVIPPIGGFDFSVLVAFIVLQFVDRALVNLLPRLLNWVM